MSNATWKSESIEIAPNVFVDVKANESGIVLGQGDHVWFHDLHITPEQARAIADLLSQGIVECLAARQASK
jgi:hypothetical protein